MKYFSFDIYKGTKQYFKFFDVYIKQFETNKAKIFDELFINNSSYRRARGTEQNVGKEIIGKLSKYYGLSIPTSNQIYVLEKVINRLYKNIYYKVDDFGRDQFEVIAKELENSLLFPVINLFKLFISLNSSKSPKNALVENMEAYFDVKKYRDFFIDELLEILEIESLFFDEDHDDSSYVNTFYNPMSYQILASKCYAKEKYIESIYFSIQAKEILLKDQNFKRYITVNHTLMSSMLYTKNYNECLDLVTKHIMCVKSLGLEKQELLICNKYLYVSLLGLGDYKKIINDLKDEEGFNLTILTCLLVSLYKISKDNLYKDYINNHINIVELGDKNKDFIHCLTNYLSTHDRKQLIKLKSFDLAQFIIPILKNI